METLFIKYIIESGIALIVLYSVYYVFMRRETLFKLNRIYLLTCIIFSLIFPFITINVAINEPLPIIQSNIMAQSANYEHGNIENISNIHWSTIVAYIYILGVGIMLVRFLVNLCKVLNVMYRSRREVFNGQKIVIMDNNSTHFTFFNIIFLNSRYLDDENFEAIFTHESEHIRRRHFIDLMIIEALIVFQWFNPIVWLYSLSLRNLHEYDADNRVITEDDIELSIYLKILYNQVSKMNRNSLVSTLNNSLTKNRIIMITKNKSSRKSAYKLLFALPLTLVLLATFSINYVYSSPPEELFSPPDEQVTLQSSVDNLLVPQEPETIQENLITPPQSVEKDTTVYLIVEKDPRYPGGDAARLKFLKENITYPQEAREAKISGTIFLSFVIEADGSLSNVKLLRGVDKLLDDEALRVVKMMPKWEPGEHKGKKVRVQFSMQVKFTLTDAKKELQDEEKK